jgi:PAS domain S-box-containing protein
MEFLSYLHFLCSVMFCFMAFFVFLQHWRALLNRVCALFLFCLCLWSFCVTFVHNPWVSKDTAVLFENIGAIGWLFFSSFFLWFILVFTGNKKPVSSKLFIMSLFIVPVLLITRQWSGELITGHVLKPFGWIGRWSDSVWPSLFFSYISVILLTAFFLAFNFGRKTKVEHKKKQAMIMVVYGTIPLFLYFVFNVLPRWIDILDMPPVGDVFMLVGAFGVAYVMSGYRSIIISPTVAAEKILDTMNDLLVLSDVQGTIVSVNTTTLKRLGYERNEIQNKPLQSVFFEPSGAGDLRVKTENGARADNCEVNLRTKDGALLPVNLTASMLQSLGMVIVARDITLEKQAKEELQKSKEELEILVGERTKELNKSNEELHREVAERKKAEAQLRQSQKMEAVGQLAGGIAHDFNNMLGAIIGFAEMIKMKFCANNPELENYSARILEASKSMADLTAKLLAFARKGKYEILPVNFHDIIQDVIKLIEHTFDKRIRIIQHFNAGQAIIMGDRTLLQNMVLNFAVNSRDAMPEGGELTFATELYTFSEEDRKNHTYEIIPGAYILFIVTDTGIGMDGTTKAKVFEPFFTTKEKGKGTGLGLASVYGTVKSHNGYIELESEPHHGAVFRVYLPLAEKQREAKRASAISVQKGSGRILVVDDEALVREMCMAILTDMGYSVTVCRDGRDAVSYYKIHSLEIDLVILDIIMPRIGGYECFKELKKINPQVKALITSGYALDGEAKTIITEGALGFLQKPFDIPFFSNAIKDALQKTPSS